MEHTMKMMFQTSSLLPSILPIGSISLAQNADSQTWSHAHRRLRLNCEVSRKLFTRVDLLPSLTGDVERYRRWLMKNFIFFKSAEIGR
jgi:hypothetical protein